MLIRQLALVSSCVALVAMGCSKNDSTPAASSDYSAERPSAVVGVVIDAVGKVGQGADALAWTSKIGKKGEVSAQFSSSNCSTHGDPQETGGSSISSSDVRYPGYLAFCKMVTNDGSPDTVPGTFALIKAISCALENSGSLVFDGAAHSLTFTPSSTCFTAQQLTDIGTSAITVSVTASKPAAFNTYFDSGIVIDATASFGMTFKLAAKVSSTSLEIASYEDSGATKMTTFAGSLNRTTGLLKAESRIQRVDCTTSGSCGWNRHWRVAATMTMANGTVQNVRDISFAYTNISATPGQSSFGGVLVTMEGDITNGFKARAWNATNGSSGAPTQLSHYYTAGNWVEVSNTKCYKGGSESASTCGTGLASFSTNAKFVLNSSYDSTGTTPANWFNNYDGMAFTSVLPDSEAQD